MSSIRVTIAVAVPAPLAGLAIYFRGLGLVPENEVPMNAIATMTFVVENEHDARDLIEIAEYRLKRFPGEAQLIPQPFTPLGDERPTADRVE